MTLDNIIEEIKKAQTIVILTHESPDGDAVASSLAMMHALESTRKKSRCCNTRISKKSEVSTRNRKNSNRRKERTL